MSDVEKRISELWGKQIKKDYPELINLEDILNHLSLRNQLKNMFAKTKAGDLMGNVSLVDGHIDEPKMTDEEIVRLLNHIVHIYAKDITATINGIPLIGFLDDILDLINRLKAQNKEFDEKIVMQMGLIEYQKVEIERLNKILENRGEICKLCEGKYTEKIKRAKAK